MFVYDKSKIDERIEELRNHFDSQEARVTTISGKVWNIEDAVNKLTTDIFMKDHPCGYNIYLEKDGSRCSSVLLTVEYKEPNINKISSNTVSGILFNWNTNAVIREFYYKPDKNIIEVCVYNDERILKEYHFLLDMNTFKLEMIDNPLQKILDELYIVSSIDGKYNKGLFKKIMKKYKHILKPSNYLDKTAIRVLHYNNWSDLK